MAKPKIAPKPPAGDKIPLSRIQLTWTPPKIYSNDEQPPITIDGSRLALLLRAGAARPAGRTTAEDDLGDVNLKLKGLSELLYALSDGLKEGLDQQAIFFFLHEATEAIIRDVQHADPWSVKRLLESASVTITDEPKTAVA